MNTVHRTVWSETHQAYVVAGENARAQGKSSSLRCAVGAVALAMAGLFAAPNSAWAGSCTGATTITNGTTETNECYLGNSESLTVDSGGAFNTPSPGGGAVWINGTSVVILNNGSISGGEIGVRVVGTGSITNSGTISGAGGSVGLYVNGGTLTSLVNTGTITTAATNNNVGLYLQGGTINTLTNTGTISGAGTGVGIWVAGGSIGTLSNSQVGLKYKGIAPTTYQTRISSPTTFGTLNVVDTNWDFSTISYGIATGSTVAASTTYQDVISKSGTTVFSNTTSKTGTFSSGGTTYSWTLSYDGAAWDLVIGGAGTGTTYVSATAALNNTPAGAVARVLDANASLSALFTGISTTQQYSNAASQSMPLLTGGSVAAAKSTLFGMNQVVLSRMLTANSGLSSGDEISDKNFWLKPFGSLAKQDDLGGVTGFKADTSGVVLGMDGRIRPEWRTGLALAIANTQTKANSAAAPQSLKIDSYQLIGYGTYSVDDRTTVGAQIDIGRNNNAGRRDILLASSVAEASYSSQTAHAGLFASRSYAMGEQTTVAPSVRADYTWIKDSSYTETGAGLLNLSVDGRSTDALVLGMDVAVDHKLSSRTSLVANAGVGYDTLNREISITAAFAGTPGAVFTTSGLEQSPWLAQVGFGLAYGVQSGFEITGRYDAQWREQFLNQTVSVKALWSF